MSDEWKREGPYSIGPNSMAYPNRQIPILSEEDALKNNLRWARAAVDDAKLAVRVTGSSNKAGDLLRTLGGSYWCLMFERDEWKKKVSGNNLQRIVEIAASARKHGCGNCGELSAIAFIFLLNNRITVSLDWVYIKGADHQFVLLDRAKDSDPNNPNTWGTRCTVADPWKDVVMPGVNLERLTRQADDDGSGTSKKQSYASAYREEAAPPG